MIINPQPTIKLFFEELDKILQRCNDLQLTKDELQDLLSDMVYLKLQKINMWCITTLIAVVLICFTLYFTFKG